MSFKTDGFHRNMAPRVPYDVNGLVPPSKALSTTLLPTRSRADSCGPEASSIDVLFIAPVNPYATWTQGITAQQIQASLQSAITPGSSPVDDLTLVIREAHQSAQYSGVDNTQKKMTRKAQRCFDELLRGPELKQKLLPLMRTLPLFDLHRHLSACFPSSLLIDWARRYQLYYDMETGLFVKEQGDKRLTVDELEADPKAMTRLLGSLKLQNSPRKACQPEVAVKFHKVIFDVIESVIRHVPTMLELYTPIVQTLEKERARCAGIYNEAPVSMPECFAAPALNLALVTSVNELCFDELMQALQGGAKEGPVAQLWDCFDSLYDTFLELVGEGYEPLRRMTQDYNDLDRAGGSILKRSAAVRDGVFALSDPRSPVTIQVYRELYRENEPVRFMWDLFCACHLIDNTAIVKGYSPVGPENSPAATLYFRTQMLALRYVNERLGHKNLSLHVGEFTSSMACADAKRRLVEGYLIAKPLRGSHAYAWRLLDFDQQALLVKEFAKDGFVLEVLLSSGKTLSGVLPEQHPLHALWKAGVKIVIGSDDPTILDVELVDEYYEYVTVYGSEVDAPYVRGNLIDLISVLRNNFFAIFGSKEAADFFYTREGKYTLLRADHYDKIRKMDIDVLFEFFSVEEHPWRAKILRFEKEMQAFEARLVAEYHCYYAQKLREELSLFSQRESEYDEEAALLAELRSAIAQHGYHLAALRRALEAPGSRDLLCDNMQGVLVTPTMNRRFVDAVYPAARYGALFERFVEEFKRKYKIDPTEIELNDDTRALLEAPKR